tara:strand:+ start:142 stop:333 length:192 start_codon:yes stop_codon:yes gene_type:complete
MMPQFLMGMDHFFVASLVAKYTDFITASSVGKESLFLVYFLIFPFRLDLLYLSGHKVKSVLAA